MSSRNDDFPNTQNASFIQKTKSSFNSCFKLLLRITLFPFNFIVARILGSFLAVLLIALLLYCFGSMFEANYSRLELTTGSRFLASLFPSLSGLYCSIFVFPSKFCPVQYSPTFDSKDELGRIANTLSSTTAKASNVFDSIAHLSNPRNLEIYQTEIWELTFAIRYSSNLEEKDSLAEDLWDLGEIAGQLKDKVIDLNGKAINSFSSIAHEVSLFDFVSPLPTQCLHIPRLEVRTCWTGYPTGRGRQKILFN
jgi:hypothetical protein